MNRKTYQSGFVVPPIIILIGIVLAVGITTIVYKNKTTDNLATQPTQEATSSANSQQSPTPTPKSTKTPTPAATKAPTVKPTSTPTPKQSITPTPRSTSTPTATPILTFTPTPTPTPTPTSKPKPICSVTVVPSNSGSAPLETSICIGNNSNPYQSIQQELVDYDGEGNWNYQGAQYGCHSFTFQNPGTYTPKAKIISTSGEESDTCQTTVTVN